MTASQHPIVGQKLYNEPYLEIEYDAANRFMYQRWKGFARSEEFRDGIDVFEQLFQQKGIHKVIIDTQDQQTPARADLDYATQSLATSAQSSGRTIHCAFVMPKSVILQMALRFFGKALLGTKGVDLRFFAQPQEAVAWMQSLS